MTQFHPLVVTNIHKTIRDAVVLTLTPTNPEDFNFIQGQYLTFRRKFNGKELRRCYSICAGKREGTLQVGIKRVDGGTFSTWANTELAVGDVVEAMPPMGNFYLEPKNDSPHYLAFAAGSGITPILSILKTMLDESKTSLFTLVYANRNPKTIMFREELEDLKNLYMQRLNVIHMLDDDVQGVDLFHGPIDEEKCKNLLEQWVDTDGITTAYICGPEPMMKIIAKSLREHGLAKENIRFELFASDQYELAEEPAKIVTTLKSGIKGKITMNGETHSIQIEPETSLLNAALNNNLDAPHSCKSGICSTCKAKIIEGEVEMIANHALEDYEVDQGYVLTCQSYPVSAKKIVWTYDN